MITNTGSLYNGTFVALNQAETRIEVADEVNNLVDMSIRATSPEGKVITKPIRFIVCGDEVILNPFARIQRPVLGRFSGENN